MLGEYVGMMLRSRRGGSRVAAGLAIDVWLVLSAECVTGEDALFVYLFVCLLTTTSTTTTTPVTAAPAAAAAAATAVVRVRNRQNNTR